MAFDKYILGILSFSLTQALWGLWLCQFCSKVFFFQRFRIILIPFVCPVPVLKSVTVSTGTIQQAGGCDQEKDSAEHWNS